LVDQAASFTLCRGGVGRNAIAARFQALIAITAGGEIDEFLFRKMATRFLVDIIRHVGWYKAGEGAGFIGAIVVQS